MSPISPKRVLVTEDDVDTLEFLKFLLTDAGYEVTSSRTMEEALGAARVKEFDLYLLDNWLQESSGIELCQKLRELDSRTPVLFCSGAAYERDKQNAFASGAKGYLVKPVPNEVLLAEVSRLIATTTTASSGELVPL